MQFLITVTDDFCCDYVPKISKEFKVSKIKVKEVKELRKEGLSYIVQEKDVVELNTLEDLIKLKELCQNELIITDTEFADGTILKTIEIYNGYRE